ncbi:MAG: hypothetical protein ACI4UM_01255 [Succinivibrio sp.]
MYMKFDFNYLLYSLKQFLVSDSEFLEMRELLNAIDTDEYLENYLSSLKLGEQNRKRVEIKLRNHIKQARDRHIPLGVDTEPYKDLYEAYLARQEYLNRFATRSFISSNLNKYILLMIISAMSVLCIFLLR